MPRIAKAVILAIGVFCLTACLQPGTRWTAEEKAGFDRIAASQAADLRATRLTNQGPDYSVVSEQQVANIVDAKKDALSEARKVPDSLLDKSHPDLRKMYRDVYQRSLELSISGLEQGDHQESYEGHMLHSQWVDWFNANKKSFKSP